MNRQRIWHGVILGCAVVMCRSRGAIGQVTACPRPALSHLHSLIGEWNVGWDVRVNDTLVRVENAHATITSAAADCSLVERLDGHLRGAPKGPVTIIAAPSADSLQLTYLDSDHGGLLNFSRTVEHDTVRFAWSRKVGGRTQMVRREYSATSGSGFSTQTFMSPDSGAHWELVQGAKYTRRR